MAASSLCSAMVVNVLRALRFKILPSSEDGKVVDNYYGLVAENEPQTNGPELVTRVQQSGENMASSDVHQVLLLN